MKSINAYIFTLIYSLTNRYLHRYRDISSLQEYRNLKRDIEASLNYSIACYSRG